MNYLTKTVLILVAFVFLQCKTKSTEPALFEKLDAAKTNIGFQNKLPENDSLNIFIYNQNCMCVLRLYCKDSSDLS